MGNVPSMHWNAIKVFTYLLDYLSCVLGDLVVIRAWRDLGWGLSGWFYNIFKQNCFTVSALQHGRHEKWRTITKDSSLASIVSSSNMAATSLSFDSLGIDCKLSIGTQIGKTVVPRTTIILVRLKYLQWHCHTAPKTDLCQSYSGIDPNSPRVNQLH